MFRNFRDVLFIGIAFFIDALQFAIGWITFAIGWGLFFITPVGGGALGAVAGGYLCWDNSLSTATAVAAAAKCALGGGAAGALASAFGPQLGTAMGIAINMCISFTFGAGLIFLLFLNRMYHPNRMVVNIIVKLIPFFNMLPGWTVMVVSCVIKERMKEKIKVRALLAKDLPNTMRLDTRPANDNQKQERREPLNLRAPRMNDIKPYAPKAA